MIASTTAPSPGYYNVVENVQGSRNSATELLFLLLSDLFPASLPRHFSMLSHNVT